MYYYNVEQQKLEATVMKQHETPIEDVEASFPASTESCGLEEPMDLNAQLVYRPAATCFVRVSGDLMIDAGSQSEYTY